MLFACYAFLLLVCYYILKTLREPLLLEDGSAELKSYAYATIALCLFVLVPAYSAAYRRVSDGAKLVRWVTTVFACTLVVFYVAGRSGYDIGFAYYVWVGIFGVTILAQFWGYAADVFNVASGQRVFPAIAAGAALGGLVGPPLVGALFGALGPWPLLLAALGLLALSAPLLAAARAAVPETLCRMRDDSPAASRCEPAYILGGLALVVRDRYLLLLAAFVVMLNCINTTGEYLLTDLVVRYAERQVMINPSLAKADLIAAFYGNFYLTVNALSFLAQAFLVGRLFRWVGVPGALLVLPIVAIIGYGLLLFVPVFGVIRFFKAIENAADYSVTNTSRHALYLPLSPAAKYEGKIAIDTLFCRAGDLLQAGVIFVGLHWLGFGFRHFALVNAALAIVWLGIALALARRYAARTPDALRPRWALPSLAGCRGAMARAAHTAFVVYRSFATAALTAVLGVLALTLPAPADAEADARRPAATDLFASDETLELEAYLDFKALCRDPRRKGCEDIPMTLAYRDDAGLEHRVETTIRARGRYRSGTGNCRFPALFVFFGDDAAGTVFDRQSMLPLTTHCQHNRRAYTEYVLREFLTYRIYSVLTDKSLRARLAHVIYHDLSGKDRTFDNYAFFVEHFDSLARRHDAVVYDPDPADFDLGATDANEMTLHALFQYMIGNTDWSVMHGHNILRIKDANGLLSVVPYDFDFSGLVNTEYAGPNPKLPLETVRERLYRGFCYPDTNWESVVRRLVESKASVLGVQEAADARVAQKRVLDAEYLDDFFDTLTNHHARRTEVVEKCRATGRADN